MKEILRFSWENMEMLLLDKAFHYLSAHLFWRSTKLFCCAVASFHLSKELQHFADSIQKVTACRAERLSVYAAAWIGPKIFTIVREEYSLEFIFLYFKTNLKDTYSCFVWRLWCDNFALLWIWLIFDVKKKKNGSSIWQFPISLKVCLHRMKLPVGCTIRTLCSLIVSTLCVKWLSYKSVHAT